MTCVWIAGGSGCSLTCEAENNREQKNNGAVTVVESFLINDSPMPKFTLVLWC